MPTLVVCIGPTGFGKVQQPEIEAALLKAFEDPARLVIPVILPNVPPDYDAATKLPIFLRRNIWVDLRSGDTAIDELIHAILPESPRAVPGSPDCFIDGVARGLNYAASYNRLTLLRPYVGLEAFRRDQASQFFGRALDVYEILSKLRRSGQNNRRFLAVVGPSGSGKSSLVCAGVVPAVCGGELNSSYDWDVLTIFPGSKPCHSLATQLANFLGELHHNFLEEDLLVSKTALSTAVQLSWRDRGMQRSLLLIVDQLEELFIPTVPPAERDAFIANIVHAGKLTRQLYLRRCDNSGRFSRSRFRNARTEHVNQGFACHDHADGCDWPTRGYLQSSSTSRSGD